MSAIVGRTASLNNMKNRSLCYALFANDISPKAKKFSKLQVNYSRKKALT